MRSSCERQAPIYYTEASPWQLEMCRALGDPEIGRERVAENLSKRNSPVFCPLVCIPLF